MWSIGVWAGVRVGLSPKAWRRGPEGGAECGGWSGEGGENGVPQGGLGLVGD